MASTLPIRSLGDRAKPIAGSYLHRRFLGRRLSAGLSSVIPATRPRALVSATISAGTGAE